MSSTAEPIVELTASGGADQVEARLREALDAHGLQLSARIDDISRVRLLGCMLPDVRGACRRTTKDPPGPLGG